MKKFNTISEYYTYYLIKHQNPVCQILHFVGTNVFVGMIIYGLYSGNLWFVVFSLPAEKVFAWIGHFVFEKNTPATLKYPFYSLLSIFIMWFHVITFQLPQKMKKAKNSENQ